MYITDPDEYDLVEELSETELGGRRFSVMIAAARSGEIYQADEIPCDPQKLAEFKASIDRKFYGDFRNC